MAQSNTLETIAEWTNPLGGGRVVRHPGGVVRIDADGPIDPAVTGDLAQALQNAVAADGILCLFGNFGAKISYPSSLRAEVTKVLLAHRHKVRVFCFYSTSVIARMGMGLIGVALPSLVKSCSTIETFERRFQETLALGLEVPSDLFESKSA